MTEFEKLYHSIDSFCGLSCQDCEFREKNGCGGCAATGGNPFHGGPCEIAQCALSRGKPFCGQCEDFACERLERFSRDPQHGDDPPGARIENCARVKAELVRLAREGTDPQGVCGHHCDHCPYSRWCGGCRSQYPSCSFATLYEDGRCPNVSCAGERGLDGCYACPELSSCEKGYFSAGDGYTAKAASLYLMKHGREAYVKMLERAGERPDSPEKMLEYWESV